MAKRPTKPTAPSGPIAVRLLPAARVEALAQVLGEHLDLPARLDPAALETALAYVYDASALGSGDCRAQAALLILGFRDQRPGGPLAAALAHLAALALLDLNGFSLEDVPYADIAATFAALHPPAPFDEAGETEAERLHRWLQAASRPSSASGQAPLPLQDLQRLLETAGFKATADAEGLQVLRAAQATPKRSWPFSLGGPKTTWEPLHRLQVSADGLVGLAALRDLRKACGLEDAALMDDAAWAQGWVRHHRHLWPRLVEAWL